MPDGTLSRADAAWPRIIQGGMGVYVSNYTLAKAVSKAGQLGVVSATAIEQVFARKLQSGDPGGHLARASAAFPDQALVQRVWKRLAIPRAADEPYRKIPGWTAVPKRALRELAILATFCEVWLAKEGHSGLVGVNLMQKLQLTTFFYLYGALLAGVDCLLVGAGIPNQVSGFLDTLIHHKTTCMRLHVISRNPGHSNSHEMVFTPSDLMEVPKEPLKRPRFFPIVSSHALAKRLFTNAGRIDGFIVEGPTAGGHNAPPRVPDQLNDRGEPVYGQRDVCDLSQMAKIGVPFYLAGGYGNPEALKEALDNGAAGVQVGTPFALCTDSGMKPEMRNDLLDLIAAGDLEIISRPNYSPTGFPFQTAQMPGTVAVDEVYEQRTRICDVGLLVDVYEKEDGTLGQRCAAEPKDVYVMKGGKIEDTEGRRCLCNGLLSTAGFAQVRKWGTDGVATPEDPVVTLGKDMTAVQHFLDAGKPRFSAADVIDYITGGSTASA